MSYIIINDVLLLIFLDIIISVSRRDTSFEFDIALPPLRLYVYYFIMNSLVNNTNNIMDSDRQKSRQF